MFKAYKNKSKLYGQIKTSQTSYQEKKLVIIIVNSLQNSNVKFDCYNFSVGQLRVRSRPDTSTHSVQSIRRTTFDGGHGHSIFQLAGYLLDQLLELSVVSCATTNAQRVCDGRHRLGPRAGQVR